MKGEKLSKEAKKEADLEKKCSNNFVRGAIAAVIALALYIALPLILLDALIPKLPKEVYAEGIKALLERWLVAGIPLVILAFPAKYYGLGTVKRFASAAAHTVLKMAWLLYVISFGNLSGIVSADIDAGTITVGFLLKGFLVLLILPMAFRIVLAYCDYRDHRDIAARLCYDDTTLDDGIRVRGRFS